MAPSRYQETLTWLYGLEAARGVDYKLERVIAACAALGDPQRAYRTIHVGGTNGKGSVSALVESMLRAAGRRVGLYTSPHLVDFRERIRCDGRMIAEADVVSLANEVRDRTHGHSLALTFFELTTLMAFLHFARSGVEIAVIEVGLGGRLDATNVVDPDVAVITSIGIDHEEFLGSTISAIASEKAGIIKAGRPVVVGSLPAAAEAVIAATATDRNALLLRLHHEFALDIGAEPVFRGLGREFHAVRCPLEGAFQADNMAIALATVFAAGEGAATTETALRNGLATTRWPGRLERIATSPRLLLDCAHNADGMRALAAALAGDPLCPRVHALFAVMGDKQWRAMVAILAPQLSSVVVTTVMPPRGAIADDVADEFRRLGIPTKVSVDAAVGLADLRSRVDRRDIILVTGSLFLVGSVYPQLVAEGVVAPVAIEFEAPATVGPA